MGSLVLLDLMGGVALLLWGLHMVHSGIAGAQPLLITDPASSTPCRDA
jgi:Na+/phosphate symporter